MCTIISEWTLSVSKYVYNCVYIVYITKIKLRRLYILLTYILILSLILDHNRRVLLNVKETGTVQVV